MGYLCKGPYEEHLGEIILNWSQQFSKILFKDYFSIFSSGGHFFQWSKTIWEIRAEKHLCENF